MLLYILYTILQAFAMFLVKISYNIITICTEVRI